MDMATIDEGDTGHETRDNDGEGNSRLSNATSLMLNPDSVVVMARAILYLIVL